MTSFDRTSRLLKHEPRLLINLIEYPINPTTQSVGERLQQLWVLSICGGDLEGQHAARMAGGSCSFNLLQLQCAQPHTNEESQTEKDKRVQRFNF